MPAPAYHMRIARSVIARRQQSSENAYHDDAELFKVPFVIELRRPYRAADKLNGLPCRQLLAKINQHPRDDWITALAGRP
jgi:hypothetical protein